MTDLINLARDMQREIDKWVPTLMATGELDRDSFGRMEKLRRELLSTDPKNHLDRLMKVGAIRSLVGFMLVVTDGEPEDATANLGLIQSGLLEVLLGLISLLPYLEADAGETLESLGLFVDGKTLQ